MVSGQLRFLVACGVPWMQLLQVQPQLDLTVSPHAGMEMPWLSCLKRGCSQGTASGHQAALGTGTARPEALMACPTGTYNKPSQELRTDTKHFYVTSPTFHTDLSTMGRVKDRTLRRGKRRCQMQTLWEVLNISFHSALKSEMITAEP